MVIKDYVKKRKLELIDKLQSYKEKYKTEPSLLIVQGNDNPASNAYVKGKIKDAEELGIRAELRKLPENSVTTLSMATILQSINRLNNYDGIIVQLPLPKHVDFDYLKSLIPDNSDVDGFKETSVFTPCTPLGIINYLKEINFEFSGKNALVIGRSDIVGKPMAKLLLDQNMNVTIIHSKTSEADKATFISNADLIVVATGHINTLTDKYSYKESCVVVDVGINRDENGKLIGDCARNLPVKLQTPVPGGVGLLTRLALMENTITAFEKYLEYLKQNHPELLQNQA